MNDVLIDCNANVEHTAPRNHGRAYVSHPACAGEVLHRAGDIGADGRKHVAGRQPGGSECQSHGLTRSARHRERGIRRRLVHVHVGDGDSVRSALDRHVEHSNVRQRAVAHRVVKTVRQRGAGGQRVDCRIALVDVVRPRAASIQHQRAERSNERRAERARCARTFRCAGTHRRHDQARGGVVHVRVVGQDVAAGIEAWRCVVRAAGFNRGRCVVHAQRRVVRALDGDRQGGGIFQATRVPDGVGEDFGQRLAAVLQGLDRGVRVIDSVRVGAGGTNRQGAVLAGDHGVRRDRRGRGTARCPGRLDNVRTSWRRVVGQHVRRRVAPCRAIRDPATLHGRGRVSHGIGIAGRGAGNRDVEGRTTRRARRVLHGVTEYVRGRLSRSERRVVRERRVDIAAVRIKRQRAIVPGDRAPGGRRESQAASGGVRARTQHDGHRVSGNVVVD